MAAPSTQIDILGIFEQRTSQTPALSTRQEYGFNQTTLSLATQGLHDLQIKIDGVFESSENDSLFYLETLTVKWPLLGQKNLYIEAGKMYYPIGHFSLQQDIFIETPEELNHLLGGFGGLDIGVTGSYRLPDTPFSFEVSVFTGQRFRADEGFAAPAVKPPVILSALWKDGEHQAFISYLDRKYHRGSFFQGFGVGGQTSHYESFTGVNIKATAEAWGTKETGLSPGAEQAVGLILYPEISWKQIYATWYESLWHQQTTKVLRRSNVAKIGWQTHPNVGLEALWQTSYDGFNNEFQVMSDDQSLRLVFEAQI